MSALPQQADLDYWRRLCAAAIAAAAAAGSKDAVRELRAARRAAPPRGVVLPPSLQVQGNAGSRLQLIAEQWGLWLGDTREKEAPALRALADEVERAVDDFMARRSRGGSGD